MYLVHVESMGKSPWFLVEIVDIYNCSCLLGLPDKVWSQVLSFHLPSSFLVYFGLNGTTKVVCYVF